MPARVKNHSRLHRPLRRSRTATLLVLTLSVLGVADRANAQAARVATHAPTPLQTRRSSARVAAREAWSASGGPLDAARLRDTALASLVRAERQFMDDVTRRRLDGWVDGFGDSAATFPSGAPVAIGRAQIRNRMTSVFADTSVHVAWHPVYATVARSGELGYTYGYFRWSQRDSVGTPAPTQDGKYLTVWRRDQTGRWRVVVDVGNGGPVPAGFFTADASP